MTNRIEIELVNATEHFDIDEVRRTLLADISNLGKWATQLADALLTDDALLAEGNDLSLNAELEFDQWHMSTIKDLKEAFVVLEAYGSLISRHARKAMAS
jgi:hypothetical protein